VPDLTPLLWPRSVAVIGASSNTEIIRGRLLQIMLLRDFPGRIYPVTRSQSEVQGLRAYPSIADVPEAVDLAVIVIPAAAVPDALEQCGAHGVKAAIIITSGFAEERGELGPQRQAQIREIAARHGMVICGPNCEGLVNALVPLAATFSPSLEHTETSLAPDVEGGRPIAVISQSGGISFSYLNRGRPRRPFRSAGYALRRAALRRSRWAISSRTSGTRSTGTFIAVWLLAAKADSSSAIASSSV
jgi:acyl-CoA synthetase (NDP forming)